jgi:hypothetical protein
MYVGERPVICQKIIELKKDRLSLVAGTVYKDMRLKPCILDEYTKVHLILCLFLSTHHLVDLIN